MIETMSTVDDGVLCCLEFRDSLNEHCFSKSSFIQWISDDEFLLIFDSYFIVYRLTPFYKSVSLTDKFPVSILRFDIDCQSSPSILQHCLNLLKYPNVDANYARATSDLVVWREINLVMADPVFLQPSLSSFSSTGTVTDAESTITVVAVHVDSSQNSDRQLFFTLLLDGRMFATLKTGLRKSENVSMTSFLYDYICGNVDAFRSIVADLPDPTQSIEQATDINALKKIRTLGLFMSTKYWFLTDLRYSDENSLGNSDRVGISLQRSGHLILWLYNLASVWPNFRIYSILDALSDKSISAATLLPLGQKKCLLLLGTTEGALFSYSIDLSTRSRRTEGNALRQLEFGDCKLGVSAMRLFPMNNSQHLLVIPQQYFLTAATLKVTSAGDVSVKASKTLKTTNRFAITEIIRMDNVYYVLSLDSVAKYEINCEKGIAIKLLPDSVVPLDKAKFVGMAFSKSRILRLDAVMKRFLDRYARYKPLTVQIRWLLDPDELWTRLVAQENLKDATDFLVLLRACVLHHEQSKTIGDLLMRDLESMESKDDDPNVLVKLKVFRFATTVFSGKRGKAEDLEFWNRVREKVERLLVVKVAKNMLERARLLDWSQATPAIRQSVAAVVDFLSSASGSDIAHEFGELDRPRCPLCGSESFQAITISEHACVNNHRYPACSLCFLPIPSFSYRKCIRCDLAALDQQSISELEDFVPEPDYCQFCDGRILSI